MTFLIVLAYYFFSHEKSEHVLQKEDVCEAYNATHMRPVQISDAKSTSNE